MDDLENELVGPIREFLNRAFTADRRLAILEANGDDATLWREAAEMGWFTLLAPEEEDGLALHPSQLVPVFRLFGERLLAGSMLEQMLLPGLLMAVPGGYTDRTRHRLRAALSGESRIAVADPGVTAQWQDANGILRVSADRLTGSLELVRFGADADEILVVAYDGADAVVALLPGRQPGVTATDRPSADPGSRFARIRFDGVALEASDVLARGEAAARLLMQVRAWQRLLIASELAGIARHVLNLSLSYIQQRQQFGRTIASFQAIRHMAASAAQRVILLENFCEAVAGDSVSLPLEDLSLAAMTVKANAAEAARLACEDALQLHGGVGFTYEYELHWYYKRVLALRTWYGDERELAIEIGRRKLSA